MLPSSKHDRVSEARQMQPSGLIFNIMRFALHDGPGIRTTVFLKGCPLSCWWCHNPESQRSQPELMYFPERCLRCGTCVEVCPEHAITKRDDAVVTSSACRVCGTCTTACPADAREIVGKWMSVDEVMAEVEKDVVFFDESGGGVTLSGGEPLMQPQFVEALLAACRARGIHTAVDTCGLAQRDFLLRIARDVNLFLFDLKLLDTARHARYIGVGNETILDNLQALAHAATNIVIRFPVIPGINDGAHEIREMIAFLSRLSLNRIDLLPYHKIAQDKYQRMKVEYRLPELEPPSNERMQQLVRQFQRAGFALRVGG